MYTLKRIIVHIDKQSYKTIIGNNLSVLESCHKVYGVTFHIFGPVLGSICLVAIYDVRDLRATYLELRSY